MVRREAHSPSKDLSDNQEIRLRVKKACERCRLRKCKVRKLFIFEVAANIDCSVTVHRHVVAAYPTTSSAVTRSAGSLREVSINQSAYG